MRLILGDVRGTGARARLLLRLAASRLGPQNGRGNGASREIVRVPFRSFDAEFRLSQGEIAPYAQMLRDISQGIIPVGSELGDWTVVDCGANVGLFSLFAKDAARIVAVEPNPDVSQRLERNLRSNGLNASVVNAAISDLDGEVKMDFDSGPSVLAAVGENGTAVRSLSIDTLFEEQGIDAADLLKLDLEGHEINALRGAEKSLKDRRIARIIAEFNDPQALTTLDRHLAEFGFRRVSAARANARFER